MLRLPLPLLHGLLHFADGNLQHHPGDMGVTMRLALSMGALRHNLGEAKVHLCRGYELVHEADRVHFGYRLVAGTRSFMRHLYETWAISFTFTDCASSTLMIEARASESCDGAPEPSGCEGVGG